MLEAKLFFNRTATVLVYVRRELCSLSWATVMVSGKVGDARFVQSKPIDVLTIIHLKGSKALLYQSIFTRIYEPAGMFFWSLKENM